MKEKDIGYIRASGPRKTLTIAFPMEAVEKAYLRRNGKIQRAQNIILGQVE